MSDTPERLLSAPPIWIADVPGGDPIYLGAEILRGGKNLTLSDTIEHANGAHFAFAPFYEVWKKPVPGHWGELPKGTDGVQEEV